MRRRDIGPWLGARSGKLVPSILRGWESAEVTFQSSFLLFVYVLVWAHIPRHCFCSAQTRCHVPCSARHDVRPPWSSTHVGRNVPAIFESLHSTLALPCQHALLPFTLRSRIQHPLPLSHPIPCCDSRFRMLQVYLPAAFVVYHHTLVIVTWTSPHVRTQ